ncbi:pyruvate kinase [Teredinibacter turnerae]|uniref:pyruvate kinase n=1 Tax=Teredinibacter turnerae TaxID=2426 RepID=UPI00037D15C9|nr:pyruvate kinase [Teredinibacter turnerae]
MTTQPHDLDALLNQLITLRADMVEGAKNRLANYTAYFPGDEFTPSAWNLALYLTLRRHDLRELQSQLASCGLSSIGHSEGHILDTLNKVISLLSLTLDRPAPETPEQIAVIDYYRGGALLQKHTDAVFGPAPELRDVRIMVTLPTQAADDFGFIKQLLLDGMDCARINCAHDDKTHWQKMIDNVREAQDATGKQCKIYMDLAGPKIRTGALAKKTGKPADILKVSTSDRLLLSAQQPDMALQSLEPQTTSNLAGAIQCTCPEIFAFLAVGDAVWIDDGKTGGSVEWVSAENAILQITQTGPNGSKIRSDKGVNFPDTQLNLSPLTEKDLDDLDFIANHADLVGYSFVQSLEDMNRLNDELKARNASDLPVIAKIETRRAVKRFPEILFGAMGRQPIGVMIARGDLAVELGGERMAEIQEELLWLCEAAHVPVIWATQVLESLAKKGLASRPELTDAAMAERAECVMLNKGRFIHAAVQTLSDILSRMAAHQHKKRSQMRALHW